MTEKTCKFGRHKHLVGILTIPDTTDSFAKRPAIVFLNAGLVHRVGPFRLHVDMGRILASDGLLTMRFDLSGIGDSLFAKGTLEHDENIIRDVKDAMDLIQRKYKIDKFVLIGLCSGATNAHLVSLADERIAGLVMIDGFIFKTMGYYYREYKPYVINPVKLVAGVRNIILRRLKILINGERRRDTVEVNMFDRLPIPKQRIADGFDKIARRGVSMLCIFTGGISNYYNYPTQFFDMFKTVDFKGLLELLYFPNADHIFTDLYERKALMKYIRSWVLGDAIHCSQISSEVGILAYQK